MKEQHDFEWKFYHIGGMDQPILSTAAELEHLDELDPKLWAVLSMPVSGVRFNKRTLDELDANQDGRIRLGDVRAAVRWTVERLKNPADIVPGMPELPLDSIRDDTPEGRLILASARRILTALDKSGASTLTADDVAEVLRNVASQLINGDGVIPAHKSLDEPMRAFLSDVMRTVGSVPDASGMPGVDQALLERFQREAAECLSWWEKRHEAIDQWPLGEASESAYGLMQSVASKVEDFFLRCELTRYDDRSAGSVNASEDALKELAGVTLEADNERLAALPLAWAGPDRSLPLLAGVNPAWAGRLRALHDTVVLPLLGERESLTREDWQRLSEAFAVYDALMASRPVSAVYELGEERVRDMLNGDLPARLEDLLRQDAAAAPEVEAMNSVERLVLYHEHLHQLLRNFVSFTDFYIPERDTPFEVGTLYMDGRSNRLCLHVDDIDAHAARSPLSYLCLAYCTCTRRESAASMNIVAAITAGTQDRLTPGRHGVFVECNGDVWDAVLVRLVENPISIRTAMTAPYRRLARMVSEQIEKFSASKDASIAETSDQLVQKVLTAPQDAAKKGEPFDVGRSVGIFAAVGLGLGALGTAAASIASSLLALQWWQFPLLIAGIFVIISGPSMVLAWLKLRKRTLAQLLDASGWAVNRRIPVNFKLGRVLTRIAELPANARRSSKDPFKTTRQG